MQPLKRTQGTSRDTTSMTQPFSRAPSQLAMDTPQGHSPHMDGQWPRPNLHGDQAPLTL